MLTYNVRLHPQKEGGFTVTVPALPGCISEGDTVPEALENAKDAIEGYISVMVKHGRQIPIERERQVRVFSKVKTAKQKKYA